MEMLHVRALSTILLGRMLVLDLKIPDRSIAL